MITKIKLTELKQTCCACPTQFEATDSNGDEYYFRYRWGVMRIDKNGDTIFREQFGDKYDGLCDFNDFIEHAMGQGILFTLDL